MKRILFAAIAAMSFVSQVNAGNCQQAGIQSNVCNTQALFFQPQALFVAPVQTQTFLLQQSFVAPANTYIAPAQTFVQPQQFVAPTVVQPQQLVAPTVVAPVQTIVQPQTVVVQPLVYQQAFAVVRPRFVQAHNNQFVVQQFNGNQRAFARQNFANNQIQNSQNFVNVDRRFLSRNVQIGSSGNSITEVRTGGLRGLLFGDRIRQVTGDAAVRGQGFRGFRR